jgi:hypothetical protein
VRKVKADDKRQAAELIELDGGDGSRAARHSQGNIWRRCRSRPRPACASTRGPLFGDAGAFGLQALTLRRTCAATLRL